MTSLGWSPGWDGHLLLLYKDEAQRQAGVSSWVRRGLELGSKILFTESPEVLPARSVRRQLGDEPGVLEALHRGQIEVVPADPSTYDVAFMEAAVDRALAEGYPSVRWSGDAITTRQVIPRRRHTFLERATERLCATRPLSVLCQYAAPESRSAMGDLSRTHGAGMRAPLFQAAAVVGGVALAGDIDATNEEILTSLLATATDASMTRSFAVDLARLEFLDVPGARALVIGTDAFRHRGGRVRLESPPPHVADLVRLLAIDRVQGIEMGGTS